MLFDVAVKTLAKTTLVLAALAAVAGCGGSPLKVGDAGVPGNGATAAQSGGAGQAGSAGQSGSAGQGASAGQSGSAGQGASAGQSGGAGQGASAGQSGSTGQSGSAGQSGGNRCPFSCPAAWIGAEVAVITTPAAVVNGVEAALMGPVSGPMVCQPNPPVFSVVCEWPLGIAVVPGNYFLQVSAPGYKTITVQVEVSTPPPGPCGCSQDSIQPSIVSLSPIDAGSD